MKHLFRRSTGNLTVHRKEPLVFTERVDPYKSIHIECSTKMKVWDDQGNTFEVPQGVRFTYQNDVNKTVMVGYRPDYKEKCPDRPAVTLPKPPTPPTLKELEVGQVGYCTSNCFEVIDNQLYLWSLGNNIKVNTSGYPENLYVRVERTCDGWIMDLTKYRDKEEFKGVLSNHYYTKQFSMKANREPVVEVRGITFW